MGGKTAWWVQQGEKETAVEVGQDAEYAVWNAPDRMQAAYEGETSRNPYFRGQEHEKDLEKPFMEAL